MNKKLLFGLIGAIVATGAFADSKTIPTQGYVDDNFQTKIPATGTNVATPGNTIVTYTGTAGTIGERKLMTNMNYDRFVSRPDPYKDYLPTMESIYKALEYITSESASNTMASATSDNQSNCILVPRLDGDGVKFEHLVSVNSAATMSSSNDPSQYIPTMKAMEEKQNKMTCTRWLDTPENPDHTDENCLLWELSN